MSSQVTMRQMLEAGVHFGHQTRFWNPKMAEYIFGSRNKIHIINLEQTLPLFNEAQDVVRRLAANKGNIMFVGTKRQAREIIREEAIRAGAPYVDYRWLGGMLTNYKTVKQSIKRLEEKSAILEKATESGFNKKEILDMQREVDKLERSLGGIKDMKGLPDAIFVIDTGYQKGTIVEAAKLGIPVIGVVDTNNSPAGVKYVIPGNDDSAKAIRLYARGIADAVLEGKAQSLQDMVHVIKTESEAAHAKAEVAQADAEVALVVEAKAVVLDKAAATLVVEAVTTPTNPVESETETPVAE